jgi:hypothetical protein
MGNNISQVRRISMIKNVLRTKVGSSVAVAVAITMASTVGVASAHGSWFKLADSHHGDDLSGYTKDQCKDGGWMNFKDENGQPLFKNQGQCVAFFAKHKNSDGDNDSDDNNQGDHHGHHHWWDGAAAAFWGSHWWHWKF